MTEMRNHRDARYGVQWDPSCRPYLFHCTWRLVCVCSMDAIKSLDSITTCSPRRRAISVSSSADPVMDAAYSHDASSCSSRSATIALPSIASSPITYNGRQYNVATPSYNDLQSAIANLTQKLKINEKKAYATVQEANALDSLVVLLNDYIEYVYSNDFDGYQWNPQSLVASVARTESSIRTETGFQGRTVPKRRFGTSEESRTSLRICLGGSGILSPNDSREIAKRH